MDFATVLDSLLARFQEERIRYAAIGGIALGALGVPRATMDLDFLVHREDIDRLHSIMGSLGYQRIMHSENVSQYRHGDRAWGGIDFLHAFRKISVDMLSRASSSASREAAGSLRVLQPEDVIGLKVQAMANDPDRREKEMVDIKTLMGRYRQRLDWDRLTEFFDLFGLRREIEGLKGEFGHAQ